MEYIILDLEWDNAYFPPEKRFINQILQIGAVKLDENLNTIDTFSEVICSKISKKVTSRFAKLTGITTERMRAGLELDEAIEKYNAFAKDCSVTMTWSNSDLYTIMENERSLLKNKVKFQMQGYLDLQKLVEHHLRKNGYESKNQISLEGAAELMGIETDSFELHTALDDCRVCALMLKKCYEKSRFNSMVKDTTAREFYERLSFKPYTISNIKDSNIKPSQLEFKCPECGGKTRKISAFKYRNRWFMANFECEKCHFKFNGRVMFRKTYDDIQIKHKVCEFRPKKKREANDMQAVSERL